MKTTLARIAVISGTGLALACTGTLAVAHATGDRPTPTPVATLTAPSAQDLAAATSAASAQGLGLAARVADKAAPAGSFAPSKSGRAGLVAGSTTVVNVLSPQFVADGTGPVAKLGYVANTATVGTQRVTLMSVKTKDGSGWRAVNAASGTVEADLAQKAGSDPIFREPQINAWYALRGDQVVPLNEDATKAVGSGMSLSDYQQRVHSLYASMLPGSAYDTKGTAGGFGGSAAPAAATGMNEAPLAAGGGLGMVLAAAGSTALVRGRRRQA